MGEEEEDESLFMKRDDGRIAVHSDDGTDVISVSTSASEKWRKKRAAHVMGEDDSVMSDAREGNDIISDLEALERQNLYGIGKLRKSCNYGDLNKVTEALNVHKCTSATCQICNNKKNLNKNNGPVFVTSDALPPVNENESLIMQERCYDAPDTVDL